MTKNAITPVTKKYHALALICSGDGGVIAQEVKIKALITMATSVFIFIDT